METNYIRVEDGAYPFTERDIRRMFKDISWPTPFKKEGFAVVFSRPKPVVPDLMHAVEGEPRLTNKGTYEQTWFIKERFTGVDKSAEESAYLEVLAATTAASTYAANKEAAKKAFHEELALGVDFYGVNYSCTEDSVDDWSKALELLERTGTTEIDCRATDNTMHLLQLDTFTALAIKAGVAYNTALRTYWATIDSHKG